MDNTYLTEAFKKLNLLNEEVFDADEEGVEELADLASEEDTVDIIDADAETEEEIEDSYVGKVVLDCCICHSKIYKDADSVVIDEDAELANVGEECPYCYSVDGYKIIGQIAPFESESELKVEIEDKDGDGKIEDDEVEISDAGLEEALKRKRARIVEKCKNTKKFKKSIRLKESDEIETIEDKIEDVVDTLSDEAIEDLTSQMIADYIVDNIDRIDNDEVQAVVDEIEEQIPEEPAGDVEGDALQVVEDLERVELETEDKVIKVSEEEKEEVPDAEMIEPLDVEAETEIVGATSDENAEEEVSDEQEFDAEEMSEEGEDEFVDQDFDEFEEEDFDELGESYLKKVYDNVQTFKTSNVSTKGNTLKLEGIITFNSGNKKSTTFLFEAKDITKKGKVRFIGENCQISRGKKSFTLTGAIKGNKLIAESLNYNYRTKDANGKSVRLYGTIKR